MNNLMMKDMSLKNKKVLVTGGAGFIGSHLVEKLLKLDNEVKVLDNLSSGKLENLNFAKNNKNFQFIKGDIRDFDLIKRTLKNIEIIFHQCGIPNVQKSIENPIEFNDVNVNGTLNLLVAAQDSTIEKIIHSSSSAVYGDSTDLPTKEDAKLNPNSPYAVNKLTCEYYLSVFYKVYGLKITTLRYFNIFGPRQAVNRYSGVISIFMSRMLKNLPLIIFGDGNQTRDFTYITNIIDANLLVAEKKAANGQIFNVGSGKSISIIDLAKKMIEIHDKDISYEFADFRTGDIKHSLADITKIKKVLDYKPKVALMDGLKNLYEWYKKSENYEYNGS